MWRDVGEVPCLSEGMGGGVWQRWPGLGKRGGKM